jgi:hypothetical protein
MSQFELRQTRDFGEIITDTFTYFRVHFRSLGKGLLLFALPIIILSGLLFGSGLGETFSMDDPDQLSPEALAATGFKLLAGILSLLLTFNVITFITFRHLHLTDSGYSGDEIDMQALLDGGVRNFFGLIGIFIAIGVLTFAGLLLFILPGVYIATKLSLAPAIFMVEKRDLADALITSWKVTNGHWWFTFGISFVMSIIVNIVTNIVVVPFYILLFIVTVSTGQSEPEQMGVLISSMYGLMMITLGLLYCFPLISQAMVYVTLYEKKTGSRLAEKIDTIGGE